MGVKVSIIVPMYRVEQYLEQCIQSLLAQTLKDIELILVDDGSPDQSGRIADSYAEQYSHIKVVHQQNMGLGPARNSGIAVAEGEYIGFVDSDDWVRADMYEKLYNTAVRDNADIVASGHCDVCNGKVTVKTVHPLAGTTLRSKPEIMRVRQGLYGHDIDDKIVEAFPMSACMSIYAAKLIKDNNLRFRNLLSEDTLFNLSAYRYAEVISFTADVDYCYRKDGQASITKSFSDKKRIQFREYLLALTQMASAEQDTTCVMRAQRMAIDYTRLYVGIVGDTDIPVASKIKAVRDFATDEQIRKCWGDYPLKYLPVQQWIFQKMILLRRYEIVLLLNRIRQTIKKGMQSRHEFT